MTLNGGADVGMAACGSDQGRYDVTLPYLIRQEAKRDWATTN